MSRIKTRGGGRTIAIVSEDGLDSFTHTRLEVVVRNSNGKKVGSHIAGNL